MFRSWQESLANRPRLVPSSNFVVSASATRWVALLLMLTAALALLGWSADVQWLLQPFKAFPPLRVATALGITMLGGGLLASSFPGCRWLSMACAGIALFIGTLPLQQALGWSAVAEALGSVPFPDTADWRGDPRSQMALSSAVFVLLGGVGLLAIVSRHRGVWSTVMLAASGGVVLLLASTDIAGQLVRYLEGAVVGHVPGSSVQVIACGILLSTHFCALAWNRQAGLSALPSWFPLSMGAGALVTVLFVWRALLSSEEAHLMERSSVATRAVRSSVTRQLMVAQNNMQRMARYSRAPDSSWSAAATQMEEDVVGLESLVWTDSSGHMRASDRHSSPSRLAAVEASLRGRFAEVRHPTDGAWFLPFSDDPTRTMMVVPRCTGNRCTDLLVGVISSTKELGAVLSDTVSGFDMAIGDSARWFLSSASPPPVDRRSAMGESLIPHGPNWQLSVWPTARTAAATRSGLSDLVLLLGLALSVLLTISLRLSQSLSQNARREEREGITRALQSATAGLWEWDLHTGEVARSPELWAHLGYAVGANPRRIHDWLALVHPHDVSMVKSRLHDHLNLRTESFDAHYRVRSMAGRWHDFVDRGRVVLRSPGGAPLRLLGVFADMTQGNDAEESLRQTQTMNAMARLAARVAHDVNNPLAGIQSAFLLIKDAIPTTHPHFRYVGAIEHEVQRISQVTHQLCETHRPVTERTAHAPVQTIVGDAVAFLEHENRNDCVSICVELGAVAAVVKVPDGILRQCVHDLVQNAIEASPAGARVTVRGAIVGDVFELRVRDRGPGVPLELRERIFERSVSPKVSPLSTGGSGFGLSAVRRALDAAGGSIAIVDADGGGAEFIARLSLVDIPSHGVVA